MQNPATIIRETRHRYALSQTELAVRAGTTQAAVSRLERGRVSPTFETLKTLLLAVGEEPVLSTIRIEADLDSDQLERALEKSPETRLASAFAWSNFLTRFRRASKDKVEGS